MSTRRRATLGALGAILAMTLPPATVSAEHGPGGAACPTELGFFMQVASGDVIFLVPEGNGPPIVYGDPAPYGGALVPETGADVAQEAVTIVKNPLGDPPATGATQTQTTTTGDTGHYASYTTPTASAYHQAVWHGTGACEGFSLASSAVFIGVRVRMTILRSHLRPPAGFPFAIRGQVLPPHGTKQVTIQWRQVGASTIQSGTAALNSESKYSKTFVSNTTGAEWEFRAIYYQQDPDHQANSTPWVRVTIT